ncbi:MAG: type II secretion system major pseudopilin GspG [Oligoflexales bacterium]|nr:type II secretion system major pseudopilin GspG [Oligoflexales bacterium]
MSLSQTEYQLRKRSHEKGMTLLEILIVVALLVTLMAVLARTVTQSADSAKQDQAKIGMGNLSQSLQLYKVHNGKYPNSSQGLDALIKEPAGGNKKWRGPYAEERVLEDPWGNKYNYESDGMKYKIISSGIDGAFGTPDDVVYPEEAAGAAAPASGDAAPAGE